MYYTSFIHLSIIYQRLIRNNCPRVNKTLDNPSIRFRRFIQFFSVIISLNFHKNGNFSRTQTDDVQKIKELIFDDEFWKF